MTETMTETLTLDAKIGPTFYPKHATSTSFDVPSWMAEADRRELFEYAAAQVAHARDAIEAYMARQWPDPKLVAEAKDAVLAKIDIMDAI